MRCRESCRERGDQSVCVHDIEVKELNKLNNTKNHEATKAADTCAKWAILPSKSRAYNRKDGSRTRSSNFGYPDRLGETDYATRWSQRSPTSPDPPIRDPQTKEVLFLLGIGH